MLHRILLKPKHLPTIIRNLTVAKPKEKSDRIKAWQVHSFGEDLQCCKIRVPFISNPTDVLVNIEAASVNPIDVLMQDGYGRTVLNILKCQDLPITLGRDFSGVITDKGHGVGMDYQIGDKVYGVIPFYNQGSHAETAIVDKDHLVKQSTSLTAVEAAALPYAALTAYSALWVTGGLCWKRTKGTKVLLLGASGGVGTCAVQMLKSVGVHVVATCSTDAVPLVQSLLADCVLDYRDPDYIQNVASQGSFDIILDCAKMGHQGIPCSWQYQTYIGLNSPLLHNTDQYGLLGGLASSASELIPANLIGLSQGKCVKWAYFYPFADGLTFIHKLILSGKMIPIIDKVFKFNETPAAYAKIKEGHLRGKVVIDMLH